MAIVNDLIFIARPGQPFCQIRFSMVRSL